MGSYSETDEMGADNVESPCTRGCLLHMIHHHMGFPVKENLRKTVAAKIVNTNRLPV